MRMHWFGKVVLWVAGLALAYYPLMLLLLAGLLTLDSLHRDARQQWRDLWRGEAEAVVTDVRTRCSFREWQVEGGRRRNVNIDVPCDRVDAEVAARPGTSQKLSPVQEIIVAFATEDGRPIEAVSYSGILRLRDPVEPGQRVRVSYDRVNPAKTPHAATGTWAIIALALVYAAMAAVVVSVCCWVCRRVGALRGWLRRKARLV